MASAVRTLQVKPVVLMPGWHLGPRIAFRFCFVYLGLFCLSTQIFGSLFPIPKLEIPDLSLLLRPLLFWTADRVFGAKLPLVYAGSGSGDKTFDWVLVFCLLAVAALATLVWSLLDRKRTNYATLHKWFRIFIRFSLAGQMLLRHRESDPPADAVPAFQATARTSRQFLSHGSVVVFHRRFAWL